jgi:tyrosyl-tRNA synthetase
MSLLDELTERGLFEECTDRVGLGELLANSAPVSVYAGFDPSISSLHVGNLVPTIMLKRLQLAGHRPIILVGGATGMIGDPSGKSDERNLLDEDTVAANLDAIRKQLSRLFDINDSPTGAVVVNNYDWIREFSYLGFLRDIGKNLTIKYMAAKDSVKNRAGGGRPDGFLLLAKQSHAITHADAGAKQLFRVDELVGKPVNVLAHSPDEEGVLVGMVAGVTGGVFKARHPKETFECEIELTDLGEVLVATVREHARGISYTEFSYQLIQGYDFVHLSREQRCRLQVGGSDQYGNITAGCELQRKIGGPQLFGLVAPLLLDSSGNKMGKTSSGERIWLDAARTPPFAFYQYWLNRSDEEAPRFLRMFSLEPLARIDEQLREHDADRSKRIAQKELARAMTAWVHGAEAIAAIESSAGQMFGDVTALSDEQLAAMVDLTTEISRAELEAGISLVDVFVRVGLEPSKGKARALIEQGGAYLNDVAVKDVAKKLTLADLMTETRLVLRKGKKSQRIVHVV